MSASWLPPLDPVGWGDYFYESSLFLAMSPESIEEERAINATRSALEKAGYVFDVAVRGVVRALFIANAVTLVTNALYDQQSMAAMHASQGAFHESLCSIWTLAWVSLYEETVHRGIIQNGFGVFQHYASRWIPTSLKESRVVQWFCSPSARIAASESIFAAMHLRNLSSLAPAQVAGQIAQIVLQPSAAILNETTGSIAYPMLHHFTHNTIVCAIVQLKQMMRG